MYAISYPNEMQVLSLTSYKNLTANEGDKSSSWKMASVVDESCQRLKLIVVAWGLLGLF